MGFNKFDKNRGGRGGFGGGPRRFGGRDDGPKQMFPATCSDCGNDCQVPFRPTGDRPVLCSNCFKGQGGASSRPSFPQKSFGGGFRHNNAGGSNFTPRTGGGSTSTVTKVEIDALNVKLDKIMAMLATLTPKSEPMFFDSKDEEPKALGKKEVAKKVKAPVKKAKAKKK